MRKTTAGLFISLDGVTESPDKWQFDSFDEDMAAELTAFEQETDTILLGRVTYEEWAPYWPNSTDEPFASFINDTPKHVVSTTLQKPLEWRNSTLVEGDVAEEIGKLKSQPGKNIAACGSPSLVRFLLQNDLLDELTLMIHPVVAGGGKRLFEDGGSVKRLELADSKTTRTGVSILKYRPKK
ncbi:MAG: dihydrofolate reductase family protein [Rubrobacteraceae bacterium]